MTDLPKNLLDELAAEAEAAREADEQERTSGLPDEVEPDEKDTPKWVPFNLDKFLDDVLGAANDKQAIKAAEKHMKAATASYDPKGTQFTYQGLTFRARRGIPAQVAFAPSVRVGDTSELAIMVQKDQRDDFNVAVADDDRFLLAGSFDVDDPGVKAWVNMKEVLQMLAMQVDSSGKG